MTARYGRHDRDLRTRTHRDGAPATPSDGTGQPLPEPAAPAPGHTEARFDTKAVLALVLGAVSLMLILLPLPLPLLPLLPLPLLPLLTAVPAVILGHLASRELRTTGARGRPLAIAALITGYTTIAVGLLFVLSIVIGGVGVTTELRDVSDACTSTSGHSTQSSCRPASDQNA